jgi:hypothetical protein
MSMLSVGSAVDVGVGVPALVFVRGAEAVPVGVPDPERSVQPASAVVEPTSPAR